MEALEPQGALLPHVLLLAAQILGLASWRTRSSKLTSAAVIFVLFLVAHWDPYFTTDVGLAQPFSLAWVPFLSAMEKLCLTPGQDPEDAFWSIRGKRATGYAAFSFSKLRWATTLLANLRGIGWNFQVKNVPIHSRPPSRVTFCIRQLIYAVYCGMMADICCRIGIRLNYTQSDGTTLVPNSADLTLRHQDWYWSISKAFFMGATPFFANSMQYSVLAALMVATHLNEPSFWPPLFGSMSSATTVRNFWGTYWHQSIRRPLSSIAGAFVDLLGIERGTNLSSYSQLWLAFAISGFFHAESMRFLPMYGTMNTFSQTIGWFWFFVAQAAAITLEDLVIWVWRGTTGRETSSTFTYFVGYLWVFVTMWTTLPLAGNVLLRFRVVKDPIFPSSFAAPWIEKIPVPP